MTAELISPDELWDAILSREPEQILNAWKRLAPEEQTSLLKHLDEMATGDGWHPEQVASARAALNAIRQTHQ
jgi:hypothetical protein